MKGSKSEPTRFTIATFWELKDILNFNVIYDRMIV